MWMLDGLSLLCLLGRFAGAGLGNLAGETRISWLILCNRD